MERSTIAEVAQALVDHFANMSGCAVAFSGGVDSAVVAKAAVLALQDRAVAVTAVSPSLSQRERAIAAQVAQEIGIRHRFVETDEFDRAQYRANQGDRCYHCKSALYGTMQSIVANTAEDLIVSGTNADDLGDYRPGLKAAQEREVRSPLAEFGFGKATVRELARFWKLSVADKPASPCLASRVAYGVEVTEARLRRIELAEAIMHELGFAIVRVRCLANEQASVEVAPEQVAQVQRLFVQTSLKQQLLDLGFQSVRIEPDGYRSGRLNDDLVPLLPAASRTSSTSPPNGPFSS